MAIYACYMFPRFTAFLFVMITFSPILDVIFSASGIFLVSLGGLPALSLISLFL
jgi:hypothetical protein